MFILTMRTDKELAEVGVFSDHKRLAYETWLADRELSATLNEKLISTMMAADIRLHQLSGIIAYKGPGSFTGLRIGVSVANSLAYSLGIAVVSTSGTDWLETGISRLLHEDDEKITLPEYGAEPNITKPKH